MDLNFFDNNIQRIGTRCEKWDSQPSYRSGETIPMWVADMDFPTAPPIIEAIKRRAEHPVFGYVDNTDRGIAEATASWMRRRHGWNVDSQHISFCPGIVPAISCAIQAFTKPNESVLIQTPVYYPFAATITACGRIPIHSDLIEKNNQYSIDFGDLEEKIVSNNIHLMILCNPHNPVGRVFTQEELLKIAQICLRHHVFIFSDEIHSDLILNGHKHIPIASLSKEISQICMTGVAPSKTFNLAGLQTAAVICENKERLEKFGLLLQKNAIHFPNAFGAEALIAAYTHGEEYLNGLIKYLQCNYDYFKDYMKENLPNIRFSELQGTYLLWIDFRDLGLSDAELESIILNRAKISLDGGTWFGETGSGFMRMNIACPQQTIADALQRLKCAINNL